MNDFMSAIINDLNNRFVEFYNDPDSSGNTVGMYANIISHHITHLLPKPHYLPEETYHKIMDIYENKSLFPTVRFWATVTDEVIDLGCEVYDEKCSETINTFCDYSRIKNITAEEYERFYWKDTRNIGNGLFTRLKNECTIIRSVDTTCFNIAHEMYRDIWSMLKSLNTLVWFDCDWVLPLNGKDCHYYFRPGTEPVYEGSALNDFIGKATRLYYTK